MGSEARVNRHTLMHAASQLGVTRVAMITDLDRCGVVQVATAIRPAGHVLQVTQGKGLTSDYAIASAIGEAAELAASEQVTGELLVFRAGRAWVEAQALGTREQDFVPADAVWCAPFGSTWLGPVSSDWTTNGLAAHTSVERATEHAVLEVLERDALARALPDGWSIRVAGPRRLAVESPLISAVEAKGFEVHAFDLSVTPTVAVAGVLLFDLESRQIPLTAGYAARRTGEAAVEAALLEAAQSRLTEIHGAREDVSIGKRVGGEALRAQLKTRKATRRVTDMPDSRHLPVARLTHARLLLVQLGFGPIKVVKVLSPELMKSELV